MAGAREPAAELVCPPPVVLRSVPVAYAVADASESVTAMPTTALSPSSAATATPTQAPTVAGDAYAEARSASAGMRAAIEGARGPVA